jgi:cell fate (sporulation/competence/biofilm development) regulator YlbF (YheA/YmcA/DUF963 family)
MISRVYQTPDQYPVQEPGKGPSKALTLQSLKQSVEDKQREFVGNDQITPQLQNLQEHLALLEEHSDYVAAHPELLDTLDAHLKMLSEGAPHNAEVLQTCIMILSTVLTDIIAIEIAHGKAKQIYARGDRAAAEHVYSTPRDTSGTLGKIEYARHEAELRRELEIQTEIRERVPEATAHLAIDAEEVTKPEERVHGKFTVKSTKADGDLQRTLAENPSKIGNPLVALAGLAIGLSDLHRAQYTHGDMKRDNVFVYGDQLKLADLGKAKKQSPTDEAFYTGNPRHEPPEGRQSQASDVYGLGEIFVETLETKVLRGRRSLRDVQEKDRKSVQPDENRSGFERYLIEHRDCTQTETTTLRGKFSVLGRRIARSVTTPSTDQLAKADKAVGDYIDDLIHELKELPEYKDNPEAQKALDETGELIKGMMKADPSQRLSSEQVREKCLQITSAFQRTPSPGPSSTL